MSQPIRRILFATDFSACADRAQGYAAAWAKRFGAHLELVHVLELQTGMDLEQPVTKLYLDEVRKQARESMDRTVTMIASEGIQPHVRTVVGIPSERLTGIAGELDCDMVILGTRGLTGIEHLLLGSTAERVIRAAPCPVLAVHDPSAARQQRKSGTDQPATAIQSVLVPIDFSDCSIEALEFAVVIATAFKASITLIHVPEPISFGIDFTLRHAERRREGRKQIETWLSAVTKLLSDEGLKADHRFAWGAPADTILSDSRQRRCDLIVMGTHGRRGLMHAVSGSVAESVLRHALCPVLTVKSPKYAPGHRRILGDLRPPVPESIVDTEEG